MNTNYFIFSSDQGYELCRRVISEELGYGPHDYQLEGVCKALDGVDLLAVTPTGSGKTGFLVMYLVVMRALTKRPELCANLPQHHRRNPAMVVVCPTLALEEDMEKKFSAARITALVINKDTVHRAAVAKQPVNLWKEAPKVEVLLLSPEQLGSPNFEALLKDKTYQTRVVALGVDEIHLLNTWGQSFRHEFKQIGSMRARFPSRPLLIGLTATLQTGTWFRSVCHFLGLHDGHFHLIRRSNMHYDIQFIFRTIVSGARSYSFPELDWVLKSGRCTVIFCPSISLGNRVMTYLYARSSGLENLDERVRMYNALNWASHNSHTLSLMHADTRSRITVATDALAVGIDVAGTDDIVVYSTVLPSDTDSILQKAGRIRDGRGRNSRVVVYLPKNAVKLAKSALDELDKGIRPQPTSSASTSRKGAVDSGPVDAGVARLVLAGCKVDLLNKLYDNPPQEKPCSCTTCKEKPAVTRPDNCNCSGCLPEPEPAAPHPPATATGDRRKHGVPATQKLTRAMRDHAHGRLAAYRDSLREDADEILQDLYPPEEFLPTTLIETLLDNCYSLPDVPSLQKLLRKQPLLEPHLESLLGEIQDLREYFEATRAEAKVAKAARAKETRERRKAELMEEREEDPESGSAQGSSSETTDSEESEEVEAGVEERTKLVIRIPGGRSRMP